jgi:hypothetical protein
MKITIVSTGEGHTRDAIQAMMRSAFMLAAQGGAPHALIVGELDGEPVMFYDVELKSLRAWAAEVMEGRTNMAYEPWKKERDYMSATRDLAYISYSHTDHEPTDEELEERAEKIRLHIAGVPEERSRLYNYRQYVDYLSQAEPSGGTLNYASWVSEAKAKAPRDARIDRFSISSAQRGEERT